MRTLLRLLLLALPLVVAWAADPPPSPRSIDQIRKEMTALRRSTNWGDADAAAAAKEKMAQLTQEMLRAGNRSSPEAPAASGDTEDPNAGGLDTTRLMQQFITQAAESIGSGKDAELLLARKVREQIVAEYKAEADPTIKSREMLTEQTTLIIDFSSPAAQVLVEQMENFRAIRTLVLLSAKSGATVDLAAVLRKARNYPLQELYIVGFPQTLTALPAEVGAFGELRLLAAHNNGLTALPAAVGGLKQLESLLIDANPIATVLPVARALPKLSRLGVGKTAIPAAELTELRRELPHCEVLTQ
jgi:hypothetical protein